MNTDAMTMTIVTIVIIIVVDDDDDDDDDDWPMITVSMYFHMDYHCPNLHSYVLRKNLFLPRNNACIADAPPPKHHRPCFIVCLILA